MLFQAPASVSYTIQTKRGTTTTDVWKGEYRRNKLYRVRLRAGIVYSFLRARDYEIVEDPDTKKKEAMKDEPHHGVDATFGVQIYFKRKDIRSNEGRDIPVLYLGSSVADPGKNLYAGLGLEVVEGMTLMGGVHLGRVEKLVEENNIPVDTEPVWKVNGFASVSFDVTFFKQLFALTGLTNLRD